MYTSFNIDGNGVGDPGGDNTFFRCLKMVSLVINLKRKNRTGRNGHRVKCRLYEGRDNVVLVTNVSLAPKQSACLINKFWFNEIFTS